jgi:hypothetical protein
MMRHRSKTCAEQRSLRRYRFKGQRSNQSCAGATPTSSSKI